MCALKPARKVGVKSAPRLTPLPVWGRAPPSAEPYWRLRPGANVPEPMEQKPAAATAAVLQPGSWVTVGKVAIGTWNAGARLAPPEYSPPLVGSPATPTGAATKEVE